MTDLGHLSYFKLLKLSDLSEYGRKKFTIEIRLVANFKKIILGIVNTTTDQIAFVNISIGINFMIAIYFKIKIISIVTF